MSDTSVSIASEAMKLLDKNPYHTAKSLAKKLCLDYRKHGNYLNTVKQRWKSYHRKSRGDFVDLGDHLSRGCCRVPSCLEPNKSWRVSGFRGGMVVFSRKGVGSLRWYPSTGLVRFNVRKPYSIGKALQLVCYGFSWTDIITDTKVLDKVLASVRFKGAHRVFDVGKRLPYVVIDRFKKSNGIVIKLGDRSHPTAVEVEYEYPGWAERNEQLLESILAGLNLRNSHVKGENPFNV